MGGCLKIIGGIVVAVILLAFVGAMMHTSSTSSGSSASSNSASYGAPKPSPDYCKQADDLERKASKATDHSTMYALAVKGLAVNARCDDDHDQMVNKAFMLSFKAYAEHYLPHGDSRTDFNQANQLLVECQTTPGIYGTHLAAQCETQEQNNIKTTTNWDIYDNQ